MANSHNYWVKIVDFLIKTYVLSECQISCARLYKILYIRIFIVEEKLEMATKMNELKTAEEAEINSLNDVLEVCSKVLPTPIETIEVNVIDTNAEKVDIDLEDPKGN